MTKSNVAVVDLTPNGSYARAAVGHGGIRAFRSLRNLSGTGSGMPDVRILSIDLGRRSGSGTDLINALKSQPVLCKIPVVLAHGSKVDTGGEMISALFPQAIFTSKRLSILDAADLIDVITSPRPGDLFLGGVTDPWSKVVILYRGNGAKLVVPFGWFTSPNPKAKPEFSDLEIIDCGQTVRLGGYEAAADAILYEFDREFRRYERKRAIHQDRSLGGSVRRLRLQRGLRRSDFGRISAKEIARIERGEVKRPHSSTLETIARRLGTSLSDLRTF